MTSNKILTQLILISVGLFLILLTYVLYPKAKRENLVEKEIIQKEQTEQTKIEDAKGDTFENVEYQGVYNINNEFTVESEKALIKNEDADIVHMTTMKVTMYMNDGRIIFIESDRGKYNKVTYDCFFEDNVKATDGETKILAENVDLIASKDFASVYNNVFLTHNSGSLKADKVHYDFVKKHYKISMYDKENSRIKIKLIN